MPARSLFAAIIACCAGAVLAEPVMTVHTTAEGAERRFVQTPAPASAPAIQPFENEIAVFVERSHRFQTLLGIGGAITDAAAEVWGRLPAAQQARLIEA